MLIFFKRVVVLFWFIWWLVAFVTDFLGFLNHFFGATFTWAINSNFVTLEKSLAFAHWSSGVIVTLYACVIIWLFISAILFALASISAFRAGPPQDKKVVNLAFIVTLFFWLAFFIADQCVMKFGLEENHMVQGGFELLSYLALFIIPNHIASRASGEVRL
ncbi:MAG: hypothetical protein COV52_04770 [Gammaproteobacteria bacterium CG11_big_fil_rev_8_21_14_0_20_46_22]|nr:MAG: hypothetical protein COW05_02855 [Gammaproteobacteria bacterium CG12_big_fil_rev_8_21_14_0_65_46_12]PIR11254.1 MAG: hypothetical protein COV52_04770 [Gammaproteobacteria bacterium CG11_big_fil_rev_8_21_14_0_20_46_22]